jgi:hypothetical protein
MAAKYLKKLSFYELINRDLGPLQGLPLEDLNICCFNGDLEPLRGANLKNVCLDGSRGRSLEPLRGMPLEVFRGEFDDNLEPLRGAPLVGFQSEHFNGRLEPLRGAPLEDVVLLEFDGDLEPLFECKTLTFLGLPEFHGNPGPLKDLLERCNLCMTVCEQQCG